MLKKTKLIPHEETIANIEKALPRSNQWEDLGNSVELILKNLEDDFHIEDNSMTTMQLDAAIVPHTVQLPVVKSRKRRKDKKDNETIQTN